MNKQPETQSVSVEERDEVVKQFLSDKEEADIKMHPFNRRLGSFVVSRDDIKSLLHTHSLATEEKYYELLHAVESKFDGETRHETALRYIKQAEQRQEEAGITLSDSNLE